MSNTKTIPNPKSKAADSKLIEDLITLSERKGKKALVKSSTYDAPGDPEIKVRSWKMDEYKYYDVPSPFPSLVRGLFTVDLPGNNNKEYRIVCRGYDKFFNIGEVPWTTWDGLAHHTAAPYTLSLKSNGCIIFIGALTPSKILVTSKHSLGKLPGKQSHAQVGERWLRKYFEKMGKTEEQFAKVLWDNNWTAIAELCDDSFEEHVLAIPEELTGLHLHGINECTKAFKTMTHDIVDAFAEEWGFIKTLSTTVDTIEEVRKFTSEIGEIGHWNGQAVEGFVVRTHVKEPADDTTQKSRSPYPAGSTFFFKVKFDEPYMMYRDWREVTKKLLGSDGPLSAASLPKSKLRRPETKLYVDWVIAEIRRDKSQFADYNKGHGIIATRERFLAWMETKGKDVAAVTPVSPTNTASPKIFGKTIIVPVAIPGCGKTMVAIALADIFSWGHTQSDDVRAKRAAPVFLKNVHNLLKQRDVVIADKNNHLIMHRQQLRDLAKDFEPPPRLLALNWSWNLSAKSPAIIHKICCDRILVRGEKHQSLHGDSKTKSHESVVWQFINNAEELADSEVDVSVDMEMEDSMEQSIRRAVEGCAKILGIEVPSEDKIQAGIKKALEYSPVVPGQPKGKGKGKDQAKPKDARPAKAQPPRYYGLVPELNIEEAFKDVMKDEEFWKKLVANGQFTKKPHVTIVHKKNLPDDGPLWERSRDLLAISSPPSFEITLGNLVWNNRIIAATVDNLRIAPGSGDEGQKGADFIKQLPEEARDRLHITLGMANTKVSAIEAKDLVEKWRKDKAAEDVKSKRLDGVVTLGRLQGLFA